MYGWIKEYRMKGWIKKYRMYGMNKIIKYKTLIKWKKERTTKRIKNWKKRINRIDLRGNFLKWINAKNND